MSVVPSPAPWHRRRYDRRGVDDDEVAGVEERRQSTERRVGQCATGTPGDEQADAVTTEAALLGWFVCLERRREVEVQSRRQTRRVGANGAALMAVSPATQRRGTCRWTVPCRPVDAMPAPRSRATVGRRCPHRGTPPGASRCSCRRGRTSRRCTSGSSAASTFDSCSRAAFDDPYPPQPA